MGWMQRSWVVPCVSLLVVGCGTKDRLNDPFGSGSATASGTGTASGTATLTGTSGTATDSSTSASSTTGGTGFKFDVMGGTGNADDGGGVKGCQKVDFLFVIDNSGSMQDEQQNLVNSFPGFISTIQNTLMAKNYHIMVTDTDAASLSFSSLSCVNGVCSCMPMPQCCLGLCFGGAIQPPPADCGGTPCTDFELPTGCDVELGAGKVNDPIGDPCGITSGQRYMLDSQPDLEGTFACAALVGAGGDGNELPMEAMMQAIGPLNAAGQCNEAFLRDDAILVVTFITDEEDDGKSMGDPTTWKQFLVDAKNGNEDAVVMLGLIGDPDVAGGVCQGGDADESPVLRSFAESFNFGQWGSVCAADYAPFFADAVSTIDAACDDFVPPG